MRGSIIVRIENRSAGVEARALRVINAVRAMSDDDLFQMAQRRSRRSPARDLHPVGITLPADVLERLECLKGPAYSVSALVDRVLSEVAPATLWRENQE